MYQNFIIPYLHESQHVSGNAPPIIRSLKLHWQPLVFSYVKGGWTCSWWTLSGTLCLTAFNILPCIKKPEDAGAVLGSWWWAVSPETCWASCKYGIIKFWYIVAFCWIFLYELFFGSTEDFPCRCRSVTALYTSIHPSLMLCSLSSWQHD
jgi:hypothetical protein